MVFGFCPAGSTNDSKSRPNNSFKTYLGFVSPVNTNRKAKRRLNRTKPNWFCKGSPMALFWTTYLGFVFAVNTSRRAKRRLNKTKPNGFCGRSSRTLSVFLSVFLDFRDEEHAFQYRCAIGCVVAGGVLLRLISLRR